MEERYEYHSSITKNRLYPFKLRVGGAGDEVFPNWHENIEILRVIDGEGLLQYGADELSIKAGDVAVINSGVIHRPYSHTGMSYYYLIIDRGFCIENGIDVTAFEFEKIFSDEKTERLILDAVAENERYSAEASGIRAASMRCTVLSLLVHLCENHSIRITKQDSNAVGYVKRAMEYFAENYSRKITLDMLADYCRVTKCHIAREFKRYTGQTPFTYLNLLRCKNANRLIENGVSLTEAAYECGFESLSYFSRTYKRLMGVSPSNR